MPAIVPMPEVDDIDKLAKGLQPLGLKERELTFCLHLLTNGGNRSRAAIACGVKPKFSKQAGYRMVRREPVQKALAILTSGERANLENLCSRLTNLAMDADIADFWPFLEGEKTLPELRKAGLETWMVKKAACVSVETIKGGEVVSRRTTRSVELHDALAAIRELLKVKRAYGEQEEKAQTVVNVVNVGEMERRYVELNGEEVVET